MPTRGRRRGAYRSVFRYVLDERDPDVSDGLCAKHNEPDIWFAGEVELADGEIWRNNADQIRRHNAEVNKAAEAVMICDRCPAKDNCLQIGMKGPQLYYGIYGGTLPGERIIKLGRSIKNKHNENKVNFARKVRETIRNRGYSGN